MSFIVSASMSHLAGEAREVWRSSLLYCYWC